MSKHFLYLIFFSLSFIVKAQEPVSIHVSEKDGLPENEIYRILEDRNNLLWIVAASGLYSYNGSSFKHYKHPTQNVISVFGIQLDKKQRIWYTTLGSDFFYVENDKAHYFSDLKQVFGNKLLRFKIEDNVIVATDGYRMFTIDISTKSIKEITPKNNKYKLSEYRSFNNEKYLFSNNELLVVKNTELIIDASLNKLPKYYNSLNLFSNSKSLFLKIQVNNKNHFYHKEHSKLVLEKSFKAIEDIAVNFLKVIDDSFWFFTPNGAYKYSYNNEELILESHYLKGKNVSDLIIDSAQNYIFSTINNGLYIFPDIEVQLLKDESYKDGVISNFKVINDSVINYVLNHNRLISLNVKSNSQTSRDVKRFINQLIYFDDYKNEGLFFNNAYLEYFNPINLDIYKKQLIPAPKDIKRLNDSMLVATFYNKTSVYNNDLLLHKNYLGRAHNLATTKAENFYFRSEEDFYYAKLNDDFKKIELNNKSVRTGKIVNQPNTNKVWVNRLNWGICLFENGEFLDSKNTENYLVEIGGEIRVKGLNIEKQNSWKVGVEEPNFEGEQVILKAISLKDEAMATSGTYRKFKVDKDGNRYAHIIDTETGYPSKTNLLSITVITKNCMVAYATAFKSMGIEKVEAFLKNHPELKVFLIFENESQELETLSLNNFPE